MKSLLHANSLNKEEPLCYDYVKVNEEDDLRSRILGVAVSASVGRLS